jgi:hypothetical protein
MDGWILDVGIEDDGFRFRVSFSFFLQGMGNFGNF